MVFGLFHSKSRFFIYQIYMSEGITSGFGLHRCCSLLLLLSFATMVVGKNKCISKEKNGGKKKLWILSRRIGRASRFLPPSSKGCWERLLLREVKVLRLSPMFGTAKCLWSLWLTCNRMRTRLSTKPKERRLKLNEPGRTSFNE